MAELRLRQRSDTPAAVAENVVLFTDTDGNLNLRKPDGNVLELAAAGTFTLTVPATGTAALLGTAQTFSAAQTFSSVITSPGTKPASDGTAAIRLFKADGTTPVLTVDTTNSRVLANSLRTNGAVLANDTALTITDGGPHGAILITTTSANDWGFVKYRGRTSSPHATLIAGGTLFNVTTSDVTGTTGTSGRLTFSATADNLKIENRTGSSATLTWTFFG